MGWFWGRAHTLGHCQPLLYQANTKVLSESSLQQDLSFNCMSLVQKDGKVWFKEQIMQRKASFAVSWLTGVDRSCREDIQKPECLGTKLQRDVLGIASSADGNQLLPPVLGWLRALLPGSSPSLPKCQEMWSAQLQPLPQCSCLCCALTASQAVVV